MSTSIDIFVKGFNDYILLFNNDIKENYLLLLLHCFFFCRLNAFLEGFYDIIPKRLISIFNEQELELLISGLPNVDIEDLKANTEYHKYSATSLQVYYLL